MIKRKPRLEPGTLTFILLGAAAVGLGGFLMAIAVVAVRGWP